jgi:signal transduction histidine kinase
MKQTEKIKAENERLQNLLEEKTLELVAKNRELEIEAALERVRSRTMDMQNSEELSQTSAEMFQHIQELGLEQWSCGFNIFDHENQSITQWVSSGDGRMIPAFKTPSNEDVFVQITEASKKEASFITIEMGGKDLEAHYDFMKSLPGLGEIIAELAASGIEVPTHQVLNIAYFKYGYLLFITYEQVPQFHEVYKRFAEVFGQTFTRFLDLQKAEAQTREAQIEAALEKVRSRSLAMQTANELGEVVVVIAEKLQEIGVILDANGIILCTYFPESKDVLHWITSPDYSFAGSYLLPYFDHPIFNDAWQSKENGNEYFSKSFSVEQKNSFFEHAFEHSDYKHFPEEFKQWVFQNDKHSLSFAWQKNSAILIPSHTGIVPAPDEVQILKRFALVFEQAYTRFLDLQKAEAQAREAQIEAALERVRSRSLAMHHSSELSAVVDTLLREFTSLEFTLTFCIINLIDEQDMSNTVWAANPETGKDPESYYMKFEDYPFHHAMWDAWRAQEKRFVYTIEGEEKKIYDEYLYSETEFRRFPKHVQEANKVLTRYVAGFTFFKYSGLQTVSEEYISEKDLEILEHFGRVFEQAYTRFLDLQKAEALTREAQIETALEKVRSRTMAMQNGEDLKDVVVLLYKELIALGVTNFVTCGYVEVKEDKQIQDTWVTSPGGDTFGLFYLPLQGDATFDERYAAWKNQEAIFHQTVGGEVRSKHLEYAITKFNSKEAEEMVRNQFPDPTVFYCFNFSHGYLHIVGGSRLKKEEELLLARFTKVFEQTYTRFLDLQKAEAQAREAQIETALERVRSKTMGMQKSEDLADISLELVKQVQELGNKVWFCAFNIYDDDPQGSLEWGSNGQGTFPKYRTPREGVFLRYYRAGQQGESLLIDEIGEEECPAHYDYLCSLPGVGEQLLGMKAAGVTFPTSQIDHVAFFKFGYVLFITYDPAPEAHDIFKRFAKVFEQSYTRFLDLNKAEAQAREAQIEVALERIRAQVTSMQESSDLFDIVVSMRREFLKLAHEADYFWHMRWLPDAYDMSMTSEDGNRVGMVISVPKFVHEAIPGLDEWEKGNEPIYVLPLNAKDAWDYIDNMNVHGQYEQADPNAPTEDDIQHIGGLTFIIARTSHGEIGYSLPGEVHEPPKEALNTLERFAGVFDLAYKRFEDLMATESQHREAQIELSLERIRGQVASMRESKELLNIVVSMRNEFVSLDQEAHYFWYMSWLDDTYEKAMTSGDGTQIGMVMSLPRRIHGDIPLVANWEKGTEPILVFAMDADRAVDYVDKMISWGDFKQVDPQAPTLEDIRHIGGLTFVMARTAHGEIGFSLPGVVQDPPKDALEILLRFAKVFDLAYSRFEDLKKAERQARETLIELALERVRSRTMAMQQSDELPEAANILFKEVRKLGIPAWSCGYNILSEDKRSSMCWMSSENEIQIPFRLPLTEHESLRPWGKAMVEEQPFFIYAQGGEDLVEHYRYLGELPELEPVFRQFEAAGISLPTFQVNHLARFTHGFLLFITYEEVPDAHDIFKRFTSVFEQTYTRFLDLQKAEEQAREAEIELALERVRANAMALRRSDDLKEVIAILYQELTKLGLDLYDANIAIQDKSTKAITFWGSGLGGVEMPPKFTVPYLESDIIKKLYYNWEKEWKFNSYLLEGEELQNYFTVVTMETEFKDAPKAYLEVMTGVDRVCLSHVVINHGFLEVASDTTLRPENIDILKRFGSVVDLTYTRFDDLLNAEALAQQAERDLIAVKAAKKKAEDTLIELQATQKQLIHSEKMASLGELTAGIAHEIQNPLNFVNNFSDLNKELIQELKEAVASNDPEEVDAILNDLFENEGKVNHHGKRAEEIVKSMLQHSRTGSGEKELTDLNALADEYLRLSYHGLRAKDKSFNADFKAELDPNLPKVNVIPQDIGRVILNLINNAFQAVKGLEKPTVTVTTKRIPLFKGGKGDSKHDDFGGIEFTVTDNGPGIPNDIKDKIFQPFFTTKAAGEGTGLGLSMSYDIITKGHGGTIEVDSQEGGGTKFIITIPFDQKDQNQQLT